MHIYAPEIGGRRIYTWTGPDNYTLGKNGETEDSIVHVELKNEGWYYLALSRDDCPVVKLDSVYFDVKLKQGTPACSTTTNSCYYSNLSDDSYSIIKKSINPTYNVLTLSANGVGNMNILFHPAWKNTEPEDGIYITNSAEFFDQTDRNYNKVYVTTTKQSIYWGSQPNQQVFVSHINGKLQVRFCNLAMSGSNGTSFVTSATANIVQQ